MSGRFEPIRKRRSSRPAAAGVLVVALGLAMILTAGRTGAQPPAGSVESIDDRPPLPPADLGQSPSALKYRIPNHDRAIFVGRKDRFGVRTGGIEDDRPLASEKQNIDEYNAWTEVVLHARQFPAAELEQHAARDLTVDDLTHPARQYYRLQLVGFEGKLTKLRRVQATRALEDLGVKEIFEGWILPVDESPLNPICVVFPDLPGNLPEPPQRGEKVAGESLEMDRWVRFAGYFFKVMLYPGPGADPVDPLAAGWKRAPLLVGKSVSVLDGPPPAAASVLFSQDQKKLRVFQMIRDAAPMATEKNLWEELSALNRVVLHASSFTAAELDKEARDDLAFADLFTDHRGDYKLDLVKFKGQIVRIKKTKSTEQVAAAGLPELYEVWLIPNNEPGGHPVCFLMSELPSGLEPKVSMDLYASAAGYSFKLLHYESGERRPDDPNKNMWKAAPLLIGRSVVLLEKGDVTSTWSAWFFPGIAAGVVLLVGSALMLAWWYRSGDRKASEEITAVRNQNPFGNEPDLYKI